MAQPTPAPIAAATTMTNAASALRVGATTADRSPPIPRPTPSDRPMRYASHIPRLSVDRRTRPEFGSGLRREKAVCLGRRLPPPPRLLRRLAFRPGTPNGEPDGAPRAQGARPPARHLDRRRRAPGARTALPRRDRPDDRARQGESRR